mgnify:CR=1 FL=1
MRDLVRSRGLGDVYKRQVTSFTQKDPKEGNPVSEKSEVWVSHDDNNIYISGRFSDSNTDSIDVTLMRRDNVVESDWFFVYLDTYNAVSYTHLTLPTSDLV